MRKIYLLDTSVLIHDPNSLTTFKGNTVIIPITVAEELDKLKKQPGDVGRNARVAIRLLDKISDQGDIGVGVLLEEDVIVKVDANDYPSKGDALYGDTRILACAEATGKAYPGAEITMVSRDNAMRFRAKLAGLFAENYEKDSVEITESYQGIKYVNNYQAGEDLLHLSTIEAADYGIEAFPNECLAFTDDEGSEFAMGRKMADGKIKLMRKSYPWDLSPRNKEQSFSVDMILDQKIPLITLAGRAGSGKSLIALACALELVLHKHAYEKLIIYRPIQPVGKDIGYLPGDLSEKLAPWFQATMDNLELLFSSSNGEKWRLSLELAKKKERIQFEALTYIRGRSIPNAIILLEEAQNLTPEEMKTILTRVGENTKIIINGDIEQIDVHDLDATHNGLSYVIEKFKDSPLAGHITYTKGERSELATEAAKLL